MTTLAFARFGSCFTYVCGRRDPTDPEWDTYIRFLRENLVPGVAPRSLVVTDGGGPNSAQRTRLTELISEHGGEIKIAVVTASAVVRGIFTAMSWFATFNYRAFTPSQMDDALAFLDVPRMMALEMKTSIVVMRKKITE
jgi:hypothetical protein